MSALTRWLASPSLRPFVLLAVVIVALVAFDGAQGRILNRAILFSVLQQFATLGPVALGLGLTMILREFDLSIGGVMSLAGCIAVMFGAGTPAFGIVLALAVGFAAGAAQGAIMVRLNLSSVGVTLGGLLTLGGMAYVITENKAIGYDRMDIAMQVNDPILGVFSLRSLVALGIFVVAALAIGWTRPGRDVRAVGSDRRSASVAGVDTGKIIIGIFAVSGTLTALAGALLSYSLAAASPVALADALVPAAAACIIGGVSLSGGKGTPLGIAGGVLVLCFLRSGLSAIGLPPYMHDIVTGGVLVVVALLDAEDLQRRLFALSNVSSRHA